MRDRRSGGGVLALAALVTALGAVPARAQAPDSTMSAFQRAARAHIQPGDRILLRVWREKTLNDTIAVDQNTQAVLPQLGIISLDSMTVGALPDTLRKLYAKYLRNPSIDVTVLRRIGVLGEVKKPDLYWVDVTMTLPDMIAKAGGVTDIGNPNDIRLVRGGRTIHVGRLETGGTVASDLLSGDQIIVGRTSWLSRNLLAVVTGVGVLTSIVVTIFRL